MALDSSALLKLLEALEAADVDDRIRTAPPRRSREGPAEDAAQGGVGDQQVVERAGQDLLGGDTGSPDWAANRHGPAAVGELQPLGG